MDVKPENKVVIKGWLWFCSFEVLFKETDPLHLSVFVKLLDA